MSLSSIPRLSSCLALCACLTGAVSASAATFVFDFPNLDTAIPDGSSSGVGITRQLSLPAAPITKVSVFLSILPRDGSAVFNGDLYIGLTHGPDYAVLLNRVGRRAGSTLGYGDSGFQVLLDDDSAQGDIHAYRLELGGVHTPSPLPAGTPLSGTWAPDGRAIGPDTVLLTDARTARLDAFNNADANGDWTLFVADWESGGLAKLDRWSLHITMVPEPLATGFVTGLGLTGLALLRRARGSATKE